MRANEGLREHLKRRIGASRYLRDVLWQASGNSLAQVLGIVALPLLTRLYAPSDFAALHLFSQAVAGLAIVMTLRFEYLVMIPAQDREAEGLIQTAARLGMLQVLLWTPLLYVLGEHTNWFDSLGGVSSWLWFVPLSAWGVSMAVALQQSVQRSGNFRLSGVSEFAGRGVYVIVALLGALALPSMVGLMSATAANALGKLGTLSLGKRLRLRGLFFQPTFPPSPSLRRMALSTSASNLVSLVSGVAPMVFIADRYGTAALGQYGLVVSTLYLPTTLLGQSIGQVYYQRACRQHSEGQNFSLLLLTTSRHLLYIAILVYGLVAALSPFAYPLIFGNEWKAAGELARWMCLAAFAGFISTPLDRTSLVVGAWWYLISWNTLRALATVICLALVYYFNLSMSACIMLLSIQAALTYGLDWCASRLFSRRAVEKKSGRPETAH